MTTQAKNAGDTYRSDLFNAVAKLGAAIRSLDRMGREDVSIPLFEINVGLMKELAEARRIERETK